MKKIKIMSKYIKYSFLVVGFITLFFVDYSNLAFKNNFTPYIFLIGSILGFSAMLIAEEKPLNMNIRRSIAKLLLLYGLVFIFVSALLIYFNIIHFNKVWLSLVGVFLSCIFFVQILRNEKKKMNIFQ